jgi:antitoxin component YwqK of YwqJK toxin-antitoxin module
MRLLLGFIIACLACSSASAQEAVKVITRPDGMNVVYFDKNWNEIPTKDSAAFYREIAYEDGKPVGEYKDYYISGNVQNAGHMIAERTGAGSSGDSLDGHCVWYYEDGKVSRDVTIKDGLMEESNLFFPSGHKRSELRAKDGMLTSLKYYSDDGRIMTEYNTLGPCIGLNPQFDGTFTTYVEGKKVEVAEWKNGKKVKVLWNFLTDGTTDKPADGK